MPMCLTIGTGSSALCRVREELNAAVDRQLRHHSVSIGRSPRALFVLGAAITVMTGRHPLHAGFRQLGFGLAAAAITFAIGALVGTRVG